jgi:hypothetical protein
MLNHSMLLTSYIGITCRTFKILAKRLASIKELSTKITTRYDIVVVQTKAIVTRIT